ncbi:MAG: DUF748 domain-containing protein [Bacteroidota bacterium]
MKYLNTKFKKALIIVTGSIILTVVAVIVFISPIAKYLVEKHVGKYLGRQITMSWIYVNPFTGYVHISNLKVYESATLPSTTDGDSIFFSANGVSANFGLYKLIFSKTIEIEEITLDHPKGKIIQNSKRLNFSDLITLWTPKQPRTKPAKFHFNILAIKIIDGEFYYLEKLIPVNYFIKNVNIESQGKRWTSDTLGAKFSLTQGRGTGDIKGDFTINFKTNEYRFAIIVHKFDLNIIEQYLKELMNYGSFSANIDADVKARGGFDDEENATASGMLAVNDFHFGKTPDDDYASFDKLVVAMTEVSPKNHKYLFDSVSLTHPYIKYERYDYLDNVQMIFGKSGANLSEAYDDPAKFNLVIEIARYIKVLVKNFFQSYYKVNRLAIYRGDIKFNDYAIREKFSVQLDPLFIIADSVDKNHERVKVSVKSGIKPYGNTNLSLSINPKNSGDFDLQYYFQKIPASVFNPYLITYTSYPLDRGTIEIKGRWNVSDGSINSVNHLVIIDPSRTTRIKNNDDSWLPLPLIMSLVRERGNVIDYQIPISGNLKDPKFHLHDVLMDFLENLFVKPATAPYRMEVKEMETEIEKSLTLKWEMRQTELQPEQKKFIGKMVDFLKKNPEASIAVYPVQYSEKEKEYIRFFEAKKKYFLIINNISGHIISEHDSLMIDKMSVKDSLFVQYLNKHHDNALVFTIQEKCNNFVGPDFINSRFNQLNKKRENVFLSQFRIKSVENRVKIHAGENDIPYNGFSFYKIAYKGDLPKALLKAYRRMNELNKEAPREKYEKEREKNKKAQKELK